MGKRILILLQITIVSIASLNAITKEEMEQARATTALWYLRYVNDGSDYLEKLSPSTIEELQKHLKNKEKENIKVFLSVPIPTDYATWDKSKMVEYWSKTIFKNPDFPEKAQSAKRRIKSKLEAMDIALPQDNKREEISSGITPVASDSVSIPSEQQLEVINEDSVHNAEETIIEDINEAEYSDSKNNSSSTYIYIIILAILVGIVVWLVVFALNTNKKNTKTSSQELDDSTINKYIKELEKRDAEIATLKEKIQALNIRLRAAESNKSATDKASQQYPMRKVGSPKSIVKYLGKANDKGIFLKVEDEFNPEQSIYKLVSTDGVVGSFGVIQNQNVCNHIKTKDVGLQNVCVGNAINLADINTISTINAGTAIFENGKWRVVRKAELKLT